MIRVVLHVETLAEVEKLLAAAGDAGLVPGGRWDDLEHHAGGLIWNGVLGPAVVIPADPAEAAAAAQALIEEKDT